jgi:hypothetical protein
MRRTSFALIALVGVVITAHADVYKSIDAQGQVHYSDQWSQGAVLMKSDRPSDADAAPAPAPAAPNDHTPAPDPAKATAAKQVKADMDAQRAEQCQQLKVQYDKVIHARRIMQAGTDSSAPGPYMTDAEADAERVKTRQAMDEACNDNASG